MSTNYNAICEQIKSFDFNWDNLPDLVVKAAQIGNGGDNRCTASRDELIVALKVLFNTDRETAKKIVKEAMKIKSYQKTQELRAKLEALYQSKDIVGMSEPPAVIHFGVMAADKDGDHRYLVVNTNGYGWSPDIDAATKMEMKIANALKIAIQDEHGMHHLRCLVLIALR